MPFFDPTAAESAASIITEIISMVSAVIFAALYLERRTNAKIDAAKAQVCQDLEALEKRLKSYINSNQAVEQERLRHVNESIDRLDKQIERLENMSFAEYYKKFYPRFRRGEEDTDTLPK